MDLIRHSGQQQKHGGSYRLTMGLQVKDQCFRGAAKGIDGCDVDDVRPDGEDLKVPHFTDGVRRLRNDVAWVGGASVHISGRGKHSVKDFVF